MLDLTATIRSTVPISQFNRGMAGKIFEDVRKSGAKVVMKNNAAECVLLSPEEYMRLRERLIDAELLAEAEERLAHFDPEKLISFEEMNRKMGITQKDLEGWEELEIE